MHTKAKFLVLLSTKLMLTACILAQSSKPAITPGS